MSWAAEAWKEGLPIKALQKIQELESHLDKLKKERQQKQFQLESLEAAFQKQKQKAENEKSEVTALKRENQSLMEMCDNFEKNKQKIYHDQQVKESQVNYLEGQLSSSKKHIENLELELKRYKSELEKSQQISADLSSYYTPPQKSVVIRCSPTQYHNDSKFEELQEKYNKEVEERERLEAELKTLQVKKMDTSFSHRDIARHYASSSVFPWQSEHTPRKPPAGSQETPYRRGSAASHFPWEQRETPNKQGLKDVVISLPEDPSNSQGTEPLRNQNQELRSKVNELELSLQAQERDLKNHLNKMKEVQRQLEKAQSELMEKDKSLTKSCEELVRTNAQFDQLTTKSTMLEQKLKKISEELSCQRQNAESARQTVEHKLKEKEKEYQEDLLRQQHLFQNLNQQFNQMKTKLNQELQQAKNECVMLQSDRDKVSTSKITFEKEVEELKQRLYRTEQTLQASQSAENDFKKNVEEIKREKNALCCQYDQRLREMNQLEEELKKTNHILKESQKFSEEMKNKNIALEVDLKVVQEKLQKDDNSYLLQNLKLTVANLEKQRDSAEDLLKKREHDIEEISNKLSNLEKESESLKSTIGLKEREYEELEKKNLAFSQQRHESDNLINQLRSEKEEMLRNVNDLEGCLQTHDEKTRLQESEKDKLCLQIENLKNLVESKTSQLEAQKLAFDELQQKGECTNKKYKQEEENMLLQITQLTRQVEELEPSIFIEKISSLEFSLELQKQMIIALQNQSEELQRDKTVAEQHRTETEKMLESFVTETNKHERTLQEDASSHTNCIETKLTLKEKEQLLQTLSKELEIQQADMQALINKNKILEGEIEQLHHLSETWCSEKENLSSIISLSKHELEQLTERNYKLEELNKALHCEKNELLEVNLQLSNSVKENEKKVSELLKKHRDEREAILDRCGNVERELASLQEQYRAVEEKRENLEMLLNEQTSHFLETKVEFEQCEREFYNMNEKYKLKLALSEESNKALKEKLENLQKHAENEYIQNAKELDCLKKELIHFKEEQKKRESEHNQLLQVNEHLTEEIRARSEQLKVCDLAFEKNHSVEESLKESELKKVQVQLELLQMDLENKQSSMEHYIEIVSKQEDELRHLKLALEKSESERKIALQEFYAVKTELLENLNAKEMPLIEQLIKFSDHDGIHADYKEEIKQACSSDFHKLTLAQSENTIFSSLQVSKPKLEKICEVVQLEDFQLTSELDDLKSECTEMADKMAEEAEKLVNEIKLLKDEKSALHTELINLREKKHKVSFEIASCYERENLDVFNKEDKMHLAEIKEKFLSLQTEHQILLEQHNAMMSQMLELQYSTEILRTEKLTLLNTLKKFHPSSIEIQVPFSTTDEELKLSETNSFSPSKVRESSFLKEAHKVESTFGKNLCKLTDLNTDLQHFEEADLANKTDGSILGEHFLNSSALDRSKYEVFPFRAAGIKTKVEELDALCHTYEQSIKRLQEQFVSHENVKNEEIQKLQLMIVSNQRELDCLKTQHSSENNQWQQKLKELTTEMETKLAIEKQQTEYLSLELESARLELQCLDLSSRSLVCADSEDHLRIPFEQKNQQAHMFSIEKSSPKTNKPQRSECKSNITQIGNSSDQDTTKIVGKSSTLVNLGKMNEAEESITSECKNAGSCTYISTNSVLPMDFLENQLTMKNLQLQLQQTSNENVQLLQCVEDSKKKINTLLSEVNQLNLRLNSQQMDLAAKTSASTELEKQVLELETEKLNLVNETKSISSNKQQLSCRLMDLEKNLENMTTELEMYKVKLSDITEMFSCLEMAKSDWTEKYLQTKNELERTKSEKAKIENHALSMEADIKDLQTKNQHLENESENKQKLILNLQEHLSVITAEKNQLCQELSSLFEDKEKLDGMYQKLKEKAKDLQSSKADSTEFIKILEAEIKTQKCLLQTAKFDIDQFSKEKTKLSQSLQELEKSVELQVLQKDELQRQLKQLNKEKELLARDSEILQTKLNVSEAENLKLSKALEGSLFEKGEISARLLSAHEEMAQLRSGIEKLKIRIESDERKKHYMIENLKDSERKRDSLLDKIESLQRDLQMNEENLEDMILQAETTKEEAEKLKDLNEELVKKLETLELERDTLQSIKEELDEGLKQNQEKMSTLETSLSTVTKMLEETEHEKIQMKKESENVALLLQTQLKDLNEKLAFYYSKQETLEAKEQGLVSQVVCLEHDKTQLLQQIQEVQINNANLESLQEELSQKLEECKLKLDEKMQENDTLLHQVRAESESWKLEKERLQNEKDELQEKVLDISTKNDAFQITVDTLDISQKKLKRELESARSEKNSLVEKLRDLSETCNDLQRKLDTAIEKIADNQDQFTVEKNALALQMQNIQQQEENNKIQLDLAASENRDLRRSLASVQEELDEKVKKMKEEIAEYQHRLHQADISQQTLLGELSKQHELEIQTYQEKMTLAEQTLSVHKIETDLLKSNQEELNRALKDAEAKLEEFSKLKVNSLKSMVLQLRKENEIGQSKLKSWIKSCKQLEQEREILQKRIVEQVELLSDLQKKYDKKADLETSKDALKSELEELKEFVEEKTREADENLEKYCSLIISSNKLEEENDMLKKQVDLLTTHLKQPLPPPEGPMSSIWQTSDKPVKSSNKKSTKEKRLSKGPTKLSVKRQRPLEGKGDRSEQKATTPQRLAKRVKGGVNASEDMEYEPEGLPEAVKKGFADIPSGESSPYILRRTTLRTSPRLDAQRMLPSTQQSLQKGSLENVADSSESAAGGSKSQKLSDTKPLQVGSGTGTVDSSGSPLSISNKVKKPASESPRDTLLTQKSRRSKSGNKLPEQMEDENCNVQ
ncbi:centromere protein F [Rhinatrema bivittatum]|uniref:centromere protein F n=1 Tax=Rhinatrema bivittatum TaxID=194408 RepID=UPI001129B7F3|nr:centromere protein F [Rhinatrema bivittatum]XP_029449064.1 centromere protein F [Rhinatrema bivittatum]XP_029449065.1 centromere protein F [Rhinatrema bivittatum]XP_029449066.1 centromere protein F [Rhinatrema bivittatum]